MFANHIKRLKQNPSYNKSSQLYTRQETLQSPAWGVIKSRVAGEKNWGLEVKKQTPGDPLAPILGLELPRVLPILAEHPAIKLHFQLPQCFAKEAARHWRVSMYKSMAQTAGALALVMVPGVDKDIRSPHGSELQADIWIVTWFLVRLCSDSICFLIQLHDNPVLRCQ